MPDTFTSLLDALQPLSIAERIRFLEAHPISGGDHGPDEDEDEDEEEGGENGDDQDEDEDGEPAGDKKGKSKAGDKKAGKLYTKDELDSIVEKAVTDRLKRAKRQEDRGEAKDKGEYERLYNDLQKEVDDELKPAIEAAEKKDEYIEQLEGVVNEQVDAILTSLPKSLQDLDLGDDETPVKRLHWLITKVVPKATKRRKAEDDDEDDDEDDKRRGSNPPSPKPRDRQGADRRKKVEAPVSRKRF